MLNYIVSSWAELREWLAKRFSGISAGRRKLALSKNCAISSKHPPSDVAEITTLSSDLELLFVHKSMHNTVAVDNWKKSH